jgi:histidine phosphotransfer protein HptB
VSRTTKAAVEPLVDPLVLGRLSAELYGSAEIADRFLSDFIDTWDCRITRLRAAFDAADAEEAFVVLISIRSTSEMVGAVALAAAAGRMQEAVEAGRLAAATQAFSELEGIGTRTMETFRGGGRGPAPAAAEE